MYARWVIRARYLAVVVVGLDLGLAAGWLSAPGTDSGPEAVAPRTSATRQDVSLPASPAAPHRESHDQGGGGPQVLPGTSRLRQQVVQCLYMLPAWRQAQCLRALVRRAMPNLWLGGPPGQLRKSLRQFLEQSQLAD
jgi:hypothetical protein